MNDYRPAAARCLEDQFSLIFSEALRIGHALQIRFPVTAEFSVNCHEHGVTQKIAPAIASSGNATSEALLRAVATMSRFIGS
jgi:hypothetical protein